MTFIKTTQTPVTAENEKCLRLLVQFYAHSWLRLRIRIRRKT